jgi:hypothetical protein
MRLSEPIRETDTTVKEKPLVGPGSLCYSEGPKRHCLMESSHKHWTDEMGQIKLELQAKQLDV